MRAPVLCTHRFFNLDGDTNAEEIHWSLLLTDDCGRTLIYDWRAYFRHALVNIRQGLVAMKLRQAEFRGNRNASGQLKIER